MTRATAAGATSEHSVWQAALIELGKNFSSPIGSFLLQVLTILIAARVCGLAVRRLGQPRVIGEILAGICLGPSLLERDSIGLNRKKGIPGAGDF